jgi:hypothetical protein
VEADRVEQDHGSQLSKNAHLSIALPLTGGRIHQSEYINWLLTQATFEKVQPTDILFESLSDYFRQQYLR